MGLLLPGIAGWHWVTDPMVQSINAIPLGIIEIILVCGGLEMCWGGAVSYFILLAWGYGSLAVGPPNAQGGILILFMHVVYGPVVVVIGAGLGYPIGLLVRRRMRHGEPRGFEPVMHPTSPKGADVDTGTDVHENANP